MTINPTTRRFPRTTREAFSEDDVVIEHYRRPVNYFYVVAILSVVGIVVFLLVKGM
jgi:hypothetical protein